MENHEEDHSSENPDAAHKSTDSNSPAPIAVLDWTRLPLVLRQYGVHQASHCCDLAHDFSTLQ